MVSQEDKKILLLLAEYQLEGEVDQIIPFGNGLINDTFKITLKDTLHAGYLFQRKNHQIFKNIKALLHNVEMVQEVLEDKFPGYPSLLRTKLGSSYANNDDGYWVLQSFVPKSKSIESIRDKNQATNLGKAFADFSLALKDLQPEKIQDTIPFFHHMDYRMENFHRAYEKNSINRVKESKEECQAILQRAPQYLELFEQIKKGDIPVRICHNDTKINNILFSANDDILAVIDLDTVMSGSLLYDFGDALRTAANTETEDSLDFEKVKFDYEIFNHFQKGYLGSLKEILQPIEINHLDQAIGYMIFIMAVRFFTDYLEGDVYYKIKYPDHNLNRARVQLSLLYSFESQQEKIKAELLKHLS